MRVRLLGPVSAETDGVPLRLGGRKQRAVFALLALQVNRPVALDRLVDAHVKAQARTAPIAVFALVVLAVIVYLGTQ